jgi:hypothetical protein
MVPAIRAGGQRRGRIPEARARRRSGYARGSGRLLSLLFVPLVTETQVTAQFQFLNPGRQLERAARSRYHGRILRHLTFNLVGVFLRQDTLTNQGIDERLIICKCGTSG